MTRTFSTTNIVIHADSHVIGAEDFSYDTPEEWSGSSFGLRAASFIDVAHMRLFVDDNELNGDPLCAMRKFTAWLHEAGAIVDKCHILGKTLSDEERQAGVLRPVP